MKFKIFWNILLLIIENWTLFNQFIKILLHNFNRFKNFLQRVRDYSFRKALFVRLVLLNKLLVQVPLDTLLSLARAGHSSIQETDKHFQESKP